MSKLSCNDLIGLQYGWGASPADGSGKTDCFQLVCELQRRLQLRDYSDWFSWVYTQYTEATFPRSSIARWLLEHGTRLTQPEFGAVALLPSTAGSALGTILDEGALFLSPRGMVILAPIPSGVGHFFRMNQ
jgi:hypothetical protein